MKQESNFLKTVAGSLGAATFLALAVSGIAFWSANRTLETNRQISQHLKALNSLEELSNAFIDIEKLQQQYLLTQDKSAFRKFGVRAIDVDQELRELRDLLESDPRERAGLERLEEFLKRRLKELRQGMELRDTKGLEVAIDRTPTRLLDEITVLTDQIKAIETVALRQKQQDSANTSAQAMMAFVVGITLNLGIILWTYRLICSETLKRNQAETNLQQSNQRLEQNMIDLRIAKEASEIANLSKSRFLANMNHELRTPLNGILGYAQILQRDPATTEKQMKGINIIHKCANHLMTLINDILDLSKLEVQKIDLYPQDFHFANFLSSTVDICRVRAEQKGVEFHYQPGANLPTAVHADDQRLRQVLLNLLSNAAKFTDFGTVSFRVELVDTADISESQTPNPKSPTQRIRFQVKDSGIGIASEKLATIFLPFEQAGKRERNSEGTGLGLAISQQIIEKMGSSIHVDSELGKGSCFWFEVDLSLASEWRMGDAIDNQKVIGYQGERRKILVIDDREENRLVAVNMLEPLGFKLAEAADGQTALDLALQMRPDLLITDVHMAVMDGLEMTRRLRQLPDFTSTPIIVSPATLSQVDIQDSIDAGCTSFFPKPLDFNGLLAEIQRLLNIQWTYEALPAAEPATNGDAEEQSTELLFPPPEELSALYTAAQSGFMSDVQQEAQRLKALSPNYIPLAHRILELSQYFDDEGIIKLLAPWV